MRLLWKLASFSDSVLSGVPCHCKTCFSGPRIGFWVVARDTAYASSLTVVAFTVVHGTWHLQVRSMQYSQSSRPAHICISAVILHT